MKDEIKLPTLTKGIYRHNKSGNMYEVIGVALDTESDQPVVVYRPLYEHEYGYEIFTRTYAAFVENVQVNGRTVPRFELTKQ